MNLREEIQARIIDRRANKRLMNELDRILADLLASGVEASEIRVEEYVHGDLKFAVLVRGVPCHEIKLKLGTE